MSFKVAFKRRNKMLNLRLMVKSNYYSRRHMWNEREGVNALGLNIEYPDALTVNEREVLIEDNFNGDVIQRKYDHYNLQTGSKLYEY